MKKILILILLIGVPFVLSASLDGLGTLASPYSGTFESDLQWNSTNFPGGKIFIGGDVTIDNELLTIGAGMKIIFVAEGADLIITTTGQLNATGSSGNLIRFTADDNDNGVYGETGERWGHLVFRATAGASSLDYCIIEFGDVSSGSTTTSYGGGLYSETSNLTISNSIIRNNKSTHGGGIMTVSGASPAIFTSIVSGNNSTSSGGGLYLHTSVSILSNCIITNNSTGAGGGGGIFLDVCSNVRVLNNTIANNTSSASARGQNVQYYNISSTTYRPSFINCIVWGHDNSITHVNYPQRSTDFINCGIQDVSTPASSYSSCIDLSGTNGATTGPNFNATNGSDWSIKFISPCRDAGTSSGAPLTDYLGKSTIGIKDIGAYEVQYSRWTGPGTSWSSNSNWIQDMVPSSSSDIIIPAGRSGYPDDYTSPPAVTIGSGKYLYIEPGARATFNTLANSGTINLYSNATSMFSLMIKTSSGYSGTGTANVEMYLTGGGDPNFKWHYVAVPATYTGDKTVFTNIDPYNLLQFDDSQITTSNYQGWVWHDGYVESTGELNGPYFSDLVFGRGYNFYHNKPAGYAMATFNVSSLGTDLGSAFPLQYSGGGSPNPIYGLNLVGNSLTCSINWDNVTRSSTDINAAVYYTINNKIETYITGPGGTGDATNYIPPLQGFFVKTQAIETTLNFSSAKEHSTQNRYKGAGQNNSKGEAVVSKVKLELNNITTSDETIVWFNNDATINFDSQYDASKMFSSESNYGQLYSYISAEKYSINGIPFPQDPYDVPLAIKIVEAGNYSIIRKDFQGLESYKVTLIDKANGNYASDLSLIDKYNFSSDVGTFTDRFIVRISNISTGLNDIANSERAFNIYSSNGILNIVTLKSEWAGVGILNIYDMTGRLLLAKPGVELSLGNLQQIPFVLPQGIYIVELKAVNKRFVSKLTLLK